MSDAPLGVLLSGGLDSSLVASIAVKCAPTSRLAAARQKRLTQSNMQHRCNTGLSVLACSPAGRDACIFLRVEHF